MSEKDFENKETDSGWICPKCGRVYAPTIPTCVNCFETKITCEDTNIKFSDGTEMLK